MQVLISIFSHWLANWVWIWHKFALGYCGRAQYLMDGYCVSLISLLNILEWKIKMNLSIWSTSLMYIQFLCQQILYWNSARSVWILQIWRWVFHYWNFLHWVPAICVVLAIYLFFSSTLCGPILSIYLLIWFVTVGSDPEFWFRILQFQFPHRYSAPALKLRS